MNTIPSDFDPEDITLSFEYLKRLYPSSDQLMKAVNHLQEDPDGKVAYVNYVMTIHQVPMANSTKHQIRERCKELTI